MIGPRKKKKARVGVFGVGMEVYWRQFPGLKERLLDFIKKVEDRLAIFDCEVIKGGLVDRPQASIGVSDRFIREDVDLVVCYIATYGTSSEILPIAQRVDKPMLVLNLQPTPAINYTKADTAELFAYCNVCLVPELACVFNRCDIDYRLITGVLDGDHPASQNAWREIEGWIKAASVARTLKTARVGFMGHLYSGMLDLSTDFTLLQGQLGSHIEVLEMCDLQKRVNQVTEKEVRAKIEETKKFFIISEDSPTDPLAKAPSPEALEWSARVSCGLDKLMLDFELDALSYYYMGIDDNEYEQLAGALILGNTLLTCKGYPCSGEGDLRNAFAMLIMDSLGVGGSYTEFYTMDFDEDFLLMGHDGPAHIAIASGKPILRGLGLYHGKRGHGVSVEMSVKYGPITIASLYQTRQGNLKLLLAEGESVPGEILRIGNTNSRVKFPLSAAEFVNRWCTQGPAHHWALGVGHVRADIERIASLMKLEVVNVC